MAKYTRTRKYTRYRKRSNWAANIQELSFAVTQYNPGGNMQTYTLAQNPPQDNTTVSQVYTVKNFEINYTIETAATAPEVINHIEDLCVYIMYVPQGMAIPLSYNNDHPEYVMAMKFIGSPAKDAPQEYQPYRISSRLARRLNTGDQIIMMLKYNNTSGTPILADPIEVHGIQRWWTKTN